MQLIFQRDGAFFAYSENFVPHTPHRAGYPALTCFLISMGGVKKLKRSLKLFAVSSPQQPQTQRNLSSGVRATAICVCPGI